MPFYINLGDRMFVKDVMAKKVVSIEHDKTVLACCYNPSLIDYNFPI